MSYSVCKHGGKMCTGCMSCYEDRDFDRFEEDESEGEEEEEDDD